MNYGFQLISKHIEPVGKNVASSKLKYTWVVNIESANYIVNLFHSKLSRKLELRIDGKIIQIKKIIPFENVEFRFQISGLRLCLVASACSSDFKIVNTNERIPHKEVTHIQRANKFHINPNYHYPSFYSDCNGNNTNCAKSTNGGFYGYVEAQTRPSVNGPGFDPNTAQQNSEVYFTNTTRYLSTQ